LKISMRGPPTSSRIWYSIVGGREIHVKTNPGKKITLIIVNVTLSTRKEIINYSRLDQVREM